MKMMNYIMIDKDYINSGIYKPVTKSIEKNNCKLHKKLIKKNL